MASFIATTVVFGIVLLVAWGRECREARKQAEERNRKYNEATAKLARECGTVIFRG